MSKVEVIIAYEETWLRAVAVTIDLDEVAAWAQVPAIEVTTALIQKYLEADANEPTNWHPGTPPNPGSDRGGLEDEFQEAVIDSVALGDVRW